MKVIAIIPARGGSKGIPKKNISPLAGKPLVAYSIEHARNTDCIGRVFVSTDSAEISEIAGKYGAEVIRRPGEISGDTASSESALCHVMDYLRENEGFEPDLVVFLQPTSPLREPKDIQRAIEILKKENADSLFSARIIEGFIWRLMDNSVSPLAHDYLQRPRRQEISDKRIEENGSIYLFKPWVLRDCGNRLGGRISVYLMDPLCSFQVDTKEDLAFMEKIIPFTRCDGGGES